MKGSQATKGKAFGWAGAGGTGCNGMNLFLHVHMPPANLRYITLKTNSTCFLVLFLLLFILYISSGDEGGKGTKDDTQIP